jgi:hypothetical protein
MGLQALIALIIAALFAAGPALADGRPVDPSAVKPEFRTAAEKRAAEQKKLADCQHEAELQTILPRYRIKFLTDCLDK